MAGPDRSGGSRGPRRTARDLDTETLRPLRGLEASAEPQVPGLTLLCHPDPGRIGEQARLAELGLGRPALLSRVEPELRARGALTGRPIGDPFVSRRPVRLEARPGGLALVPDPARAQELRVDGEPAAGPETFVSQAALGRGVVLELAGRVALLLHGLPMPRAGEPRADLGLVGISEAMEALRGEVRRAAAVEAPVLLRGESGTGKELVAGALHALGPRRGRPLVRVNMAALPASTAAAELFGHRRGAFTGAAADREGYFGRSHGGTLFLDEVGDTPADVQPMLLRALESGEVQPVGGESARRVDVRVLAATETDLERAVDEGRFRLALLHRLAGYEIRLPSLAERREDIPLLFLHFLEEELEGLGLGSRLAAPADRGRPPYLPAPLVSRLVRARWPGNVRQLRNVARRLALACGGDESLGLPPSVEALLGEPAPGGEAFEDETVEAGSPPIDDDERARAAEITEEALRQALRQCGFRPGAAAARLGIGRTTLYRLMERCPSIRKAVDIPDDELRRCHAERGGDPAAMAAQLEVSERALKLRLRRLDLETD